ncbi:MAG: SpoIID/LytB domain-containing protein [Planctomycetota bacterium]|nr:SpoIID/LytB domain-containing protein [Planctomycetota bacterium]
MNRRALLHGALGASVGALVAGCVGSGIQPSPTRRSRAVDASAPRSSPLMGPAKVSVLLLAARGLDQLVLTDQARGATSFSRAGSLVLASDGQVGERLVLEPRTARTGLTFDGKSYDGRFIVEARRAGGLELINEIDVEDYVEGVVAAELAIWSGELAEMAAQAVCVRTYALATLAVRGQSSSRPVLVDSTLDQAYRGRYLPGDSNTARAVARRLRDAVELTRDQVLTRLGRLEDARFHASCGGRTASLTEVFASAPSGPPPVDCPPCLYRAAQERLAGRPDPKRPLGWQREFTLGELTRAAEGLELGPRFESLAAAQRDRSGRWMAATVRGGGVERRVRMDELRAAFGAAELKSAWIHGSNPPAGSPISRSLTVHGIGRGHGVGLCQEGARDLAKEGATFQKILAHYYPGSSLVRRTIR